MRAPRFSNEYFKKLQLLGRRELRRKILCLKQSNWNRKWNRNVSQGGFFTYIVLLLGTVFVLFWAQIAAEMNVVIHTMQDEVKLWEVNYDAEGMLTVLLQEYKQNPDAMIEEVKTVYETDGKREVSYRLHRPKRSGDEGRLQVSVAHVQTGLRAQYIAMFTDEGDDSERQVLITSVRRVN